MERRVAGNSVLSRRAVLTGAASVIALTSGARLFYLHNERFQRASVFIAKADNYSLDLRTIILRGLKELGLHRAWAKGRRILLKPNLVEPAEGGQHVTTHPAIVRALVEVFRGWDAKEVTVAEGSGHCRDIGLVLEITGLRKLLRELNVSFVDLNHDATVVIKNELGMTRLARWLLPATLNRSDIIVSIAKMKTHHWAGVTLSMKNLFGCLPGICYGWPKSVLHEIGIDKAILDLNHTIRVDLAVVDGIVGMEGDGPIMGTAKQSGVIVMGTNSTAVDATCTRIMGIDPYRIDHLAGASGRLGPISDERTEQRGEMIMDVATDFALPEAWTFGGGRETIGGS